MVTIKDVAEKTGFSICTVSRALANKGSIKEQTKTIILETAKELGYQPNRTAVSLKTGRSNAIALIIPDVTNMYYPRLVKYVEKYASENGFIVYLCDSDNRLELEKRFIQTIIANHSAGAIIAPCSKEHVHIKELKKYGIPYVYLNRYYEDDADSCIQSDNHQAGYECTKYLIDKGFKHIGGVFLSFNNMVYEQRYNGMMQAIKDHGNNQCRVSFFFDMDDSDQSCKQLEEVLRGPDRPQVFFATNDMLALAVYKAAYKAGLKIPEDISVIGYDNDLLTDKIIPPLTTYYSPAKEMCKAAMENILARINGGESKPAPMIGGWLVERDSVKI